MTDLNIKHARSVATSTNTSVNRVKFQRACVCFPMIGFSESSYGNGMQREDKDLRYFSLRPTARPMTSARITVAVTQETIFVLRRLRPQQDSGGGGTSQSGTLRFLLLALYWTSGIWSSSRRLAVGFHCGRSTASHTSAFPMTLS